MSGANTLFISHPVDSGHRFVHHFRINRSAIRPKIQLCIILHSYRSMHHCSLAFLCWFVKDRRGQRTCSSHCNKRQRTIEADMGWCVTIRQYCANDEADRLPKVILMRWRFSLEVVCIRPKLSLCYTSFFVLFPHSLHTLCTTEILRSTRPKIFRKETLQQSLIPIMRPLSKSLI